MSRARAAGLAPVLALLLNAFVWGVSWWPFRQLQGLGLHPLWATTVIYVLSAVVIVAWRAAALGQLRRSPALWVILLASGTTNATFNWAVSIGDVVRVVLLFYLMPLWALLLARVLLGERLTPGAVARVAAALAGAALVLSHEAAGSLQGLAGAIGLPEGLALLGGFSFALNNVMLRRHADTPESGRALAMFTGGAVVAGGVAALVSSGALHLQGGGVAWPSSPLAWGLPAFALAFAFMASNLGLQYGASRLSATTTAVVMPAEVLFAALSAVWWGGAVLQPTVLLGGALILGATLAALLMPAAGPVAGASLADDTQTDALPAETTAPAGGPDRR